MSFVTSFGFIYSQDGDLGQNIEEGDSGIDDIEIEERYRDFNAMFGYYNISFEVKYSGGQYLTYDVEHDGLSAIIKNTIYTPTSCIFTFKNLRGGRDAWFHFTAHSQTGKKKYTHHVKFIPNETLKTTEIGRTLNNEEGLVSIDLRSELPEDAYIYEYSYEQDGVSKPYSWALSPVCEYAYIFLNRLKMDKTTKVLIKSYFEGHFITFIHEIPPVSSSNITTNEADIVAPSKIMVFRVDGKHEGTFESYSSLETSTLTKGIYLIKELDENNNVLQTKKHVIN